MTGLQGPVNCVPPATGLLNVCIPRYDWAPPHEPLGATWARVISLPWSQAFVCCSFVRHAPPVCPFTIPYHFNKPVMEPKLPYRYLLYG